MASVGLQNTTLLLLISEVLSCCPVKAQHNLCRLSTQGGVGKESDKVTDAFKNGGGPAGENIHLPHKWPSLKHV